MEIRSIFVYIIYIQLPHILQVAVEAQGRFPSPASLETGTNSFIAVSISKQQLLLCLEGDKLGFS